MSAFLFDEGTSGTGDIRRALEELRIFTSQGKVGIGTNPLDEQQLQVNGRVKASRAIAADELITKAQLDEINLTEFGDITVANLTVQGNITDYQQLNATDSLIFLANNNSGDTKDIGFYGKYNDGNVKYAGIYRDATDGKFKGFYDLITEPSDTIPAGGLVANWDFGTISTSTINDVIDLTVDKLNGGGLFSELNPTTDIIFKEADGVATKAINFFSGPIYNGGAYNWSIHQNESKELQISGTLPRINVSDSEIKLGTTLNANTNTISNLPAAGSNGQAVRYEEWNSTNTVANAALPKSGGTMTGVISMGSNKITNLAAATSSGDAVRFDQFSALSGTPGLVEAEKAMVVDSNKDIKTVRKLDVREIYGENAQTLKIYSNNASIDMGTTVGSLVIFNNSTNSGDLCSFQNGAGILRLQTQHATTGGIQLNNVNTAGSVVFDFNSVTRCEITNTGLDLKNNTISNFGGFNTTNLNLSGTTDVALQVLGTDKIVCNTDIHILDTVNMNENGLTNCISMSGVNNNGLIIASGYEYYNDSLLGNVRLETEKDFGKNVIINPNEDTIIKQGGYGQTGGIPTWTRTDEGSEIARFKSTGLQFAGGKGLVTPYLTAERTTDLSISNGVDTDMSMDIISNVGIYKQGQNYVVEEPGLYQINMDVTFEQNSTGQRASWIEMVTTGHYSANRRHASLRCDTATNGNTNLSGSCLIMMDESDSFRPKVYQNSGGALNVKGLGVETSTNLSIIKVGVF